MSKPNLRFTSRFKRVSGNAVGRNSKRIVGCENCNFMQLHSPSPKATNSASHEVAETGINKATGKPYATHDLCPRCNLKRLRVYDSQAEFGRAQELKILQSNGDIFFLEFQVPFQLHAVTPQGVQVPLYKYVADFTYRTIPTADNPAEYIVEDVKPKGGIVTDVFMMKKKHFEAEYGIDLKIVER